MKDKIEARALPDIMDGFYGVPVAELVGLQLISFANGSDKRALLSGVISNGMVGQRAQAYSRLAPPGFSVDIVAPTQAVAQNSGFIENAVASSSVVILTGGAHVGRQRAGDYGQDEVAGVYGAPDDIRDAVDTALLYEALKQEVPVVAVCRGLQVAAAYFGVGLSRVPQAHHPQKMQPVDHHVSRINGTAHAIDDMSVASAHHGGVLLRHGARFVDVGFEIGLVGPDEQGEMSDDSPLELVVHEVRGIVLAQFHPERMTGQSGDIAQSFFQNFAR